MPLIEKHRGGVRVLTWSVLRQRQRGGRFLGGRFGQALVTGADIGIGDDIVNSTFDRL